MRDIDKIKFSKNEALVFEALKNASHPVGAYDLLDQLKVHGLKSPPQVYRALERLTELKVAHRVESLNAWTSCREANHENAPVFVICDNCGDVTEHIDRPLNASLEKIYKKNGFVPGNPILEIHGRCSDCISAEL